MAKAYLGKISALVTANTSDFNAKLNASAKEVRSFAASMQSSLSRAQTEATASLRGIYTESQKVSRALQAVATQRLSFKGFDNSSITSIKQAVDQFKALQNASVAVNQPLAGAARTLERLSASVQRSFDPALKSAQKSAEYLSAALNRGGIIGEKSFDRIQKKAIAAAEAADRLAEASQLASVGPRGNELAFAAPRVRDALVASADVRQRAANAPASALESGAVANDVQKLVAIDNLIQKRRAEIESGTALKIDTTQARASLENLLSVAERVRGNVTAAIGSTSTTRPGAASRDLGLFGSQVAPSAEQAIARAREVSAEFARLPEAAQAGLRGLAGIASNVANGVQAGTSNAAQLLAVLARLSSGITQATAASREFTLVQSQPQAGGLGLFGSQVAPSAEQAIARAREVSAEFAKLPESAQAGLRGLAGIVSNVADGVQAGTSNADQLNSVLNQLEQRMNGLGNPTGTFGPTLPPGFGGSSDAGLGAPLDAASRQLDQFRSGIVSAKSQLDSMPASVRSQFIPAVQAAEAEFIRLVALGPRATAEEIENATRDMDALTAAVRRTTQAAQVQGFGDFINSANVRQSIGELQALQQVLVQIAAVAGGPAARAYEAYRQRLQAAISAGETGLPRVRRELIELQREAARAAAETGKISFGAAMRRISRAGDVARGGVDRFSLAAQQAGFAIDDFFSATGGIDQKIRAVSNNISQLGFVLGGTTGLFAALAVTITTQVGLALYKYVLGGKEAEEQQKRLKLQIDAVNSSLERQKALTESLAQSYKALAVAIGSIGLSSQGRQTQERRRQLADIEAEQKRRRAEIVEQTSPEVSVRRARVAGLKEQLEKETNENTRARLQSQIAGLEATIQLALGRAEQNAGFRINEANRNSQRFGTTPLQELQARRGRVRDELQAAVRVRDTLGAENAPRWVEKIEELSAVLTSLEVAIQRLRDESVIQASRRGFSIADQLGRSQRNAAEITGFTFTDEVANKFSAELESLLTRLSEADSEEVTNAIARQIEGLSALSRTVEIASTATLEFTKSLVSAAGDLSRTVESELISRAETLRRQANATEAAFGSEDERTRLARGDAQQIENARRTATRNRQEIEAEISGRRLEFEKAALEGRGDPRAVQIADRIRRLEEVQADPAASAQRKEASRLEADALRQTLRDIFEASQEVRNLRRRADLGDIEAQRQLQDIENRASGRELAKTPAQRAGEELAKQLGQLQAAFAAGEIGQPEMDAASQRLTDDAMRQQAPTITAMADAVRNAVTMGPSRAALNATDATTTQGQQELNRLLRGDDAARQGDMEGLQRETNRLLELIAKKENPVAG